MEGEGIVERGGMKGFPEPNFKANWENGWLAPFLQSLIVQLPSRRDWQMMKRNFSAEDQTLRTFPDYTACAKLSLIYVTEAFYMISPSEFAFAC